MRSVIVNITIDSATGRFDTNNAGTFTSSSLSLIIISGSQNTPNFYYRDTTAGSVNLTATVTDVGNTNLTLNETGTVNKTVNKANTTTSISLTGGTNRGCQIFCVIEFSGSPGIGIRPSNSIAN